MTVTFGGRRCLKEKFFCETVLGLENKKKQTTSKRTKSPAATMVQNPNLNLSFFSDDKFSIFHNYSGPLPKKIPVHLCDNESGTATSVLFKNVFGIFSYLEFHYLHVYG